MARWSMVAVRKQARSEFECRPNLALCHILIFEKFLCQSTNERFFRFHETMQ